MKKNTQKGFTLVELLVVIAILAILASVAVVGYTSFIDNANKQKAQSELAQVKTSITALDFENDDFNLVDGLQEADVAGLEAALATLKTDNGLTGDFAVVVADGTITYTVEGKTATWNIATGAVTVA